MRVRIMRLIIESVFTFSFIAMFSSLFLPNKTPLDFNKFYDCGS